MSAKDVERMRFADSQTQYPHLENRKARAHPRSPVQDDLASVLGDWVRKATGENFKYERDMTRFRLRLPRSTNIHRLHFISGYD